MSATILNHPANSQALGMIATSPSWRRFWCPWFAWRNTTYRGVSR